MRNDEIYDEGFDAGSHGELLSTNPYDDPDDQVLWSEGWQDGADAAGWLDEEDK